MQTLSAGTLFQDSHSRQVFAFEVFEKGATPRGDIRDPIRDPIFGDSGECITAPRNREGLASGNGFCDHLGARSERVEFKYPQWTIPDNRGRAIEQLSKVGGGLRSDIQDHIIGGNLTDSLGRGLSLL